MKSRPRSLVAHLIRVVSYPHGVQHRLRSLLTVVGVALGVAAVTAVSDVSESVMASFRHMVQVVAGDCELEVTAPGSGVDETLIEQAAHVPGVRAAGGVVESFVPLAGGPDQSLYLLGVDFLGSRVFEAQLSRQSVDIPDETVFVAQPDSVVVTDQLAQRLGLADGSTLRVTAPGGERTLRVRGTLHDAALARLFDGAMLLMDLPAAQLLLQRDRRVDRIAVQLEPGARLEDVRTRLAAALGPAVQVATPDARGRQSESLLLTLRTMLATMSALAVIVGVLIVYHTVAVSVQQRRREFAMLNAVGVGRRTLLVLCLAETTAIAALGVALGLAVGRLIAGIAARLVGSTASELWLTVNVTQHAWSRSGTVTAILVGFGTSLVAAYLAVRATFRTPTVEALRPAGLESDEAQAMLRPALLAALLVASSWVIITIVPPASGFVVLVTAIVASDGAGYASAAILSPVLVATIGRALRRLAPRLPSFPARLAAENLPRSPGRSGATVATIAVTMAMAVIVTALVESFERGVFTWLEQHFAADLFVGAGTRVRLFGGPPMGEEIRDALADVPGVAAVERFRLVSVRVGGEPAFLHGIAVAQRLEHGGVTMVEGDFATAAAGLTSGSGVLLSDNLAYKLSLHRGDRVDLETPQGPRSFRVEGVFLDYLVARDLGAVAVADTQLAALWGDRLADLFKVWLRPGASASTVRTAILARLGGGYYAVTARQFLDGVRSITRQFFLATWALQIVAALVGVIGVVNAQLATVLDRATEISVLHTIGVATRDLTRGVILECGALGAIGGLTGLALGVMLGAQFVLVSLRRVTGMALPFTVSMAPLLAGVACAALVSALAGWVPARAAARLESGQQSID